MRWHDPYRMLRHHNPIRLAGTPLIGMIVSTNAVMYCSDPLLTNFCRRLPSQVSVV